MPTEKILYQNPLTLPTANEWIMEGNGLTEWLPTGLELRAKNFTPKRSNIETDHFVYWLNRDFPANLTISWDFRFPAKSQNPEGLAILFFSATSLLGQDIFTPTLQKRDGIFERYYDGDINCFHTSYLALGRGSCNLRKNKGFHLPASGPDLLAQTPPDSWNQVQVSKINNTVELKVNTQPIFSWHDDGKQFGPTIGPGKLGFRQQNNLLRGAYRNLQITTPADS